MHSRSFFCFAWAIGTVLAAASIAQTPPKFRLGDNVKPVRYHVELKVIPSQSTFSGSVDIDVSLRIPQRVLWLNATGLTIRKASVRAMGTTMPARPITAGRDFLGLSLDAPVATGPATIHVAFEGKFAKNSSDGLFVNQDRGNWYAFTQFEPVSARRAFPCFDEPQFKVPWQLTLEVPRDEIAVSNTPVLSQTDGAEGLKVVRFAETTPLPSYLVALAVGPFDIVDAGKAGMHDTPIRIITPRGRGSEAHYAAQVTSKILILLENYFGIPYPYKKLDAVAIPLVYGFGAMENAGMITYAQSHLLAKPAEESIEFQRDYATVAAHEMAHQWVGDLVTTAWWNDIWLNEAFATWMEQKIVNEWKPNWNIPVSEVLSAQRAMGIDSLVSTRRIRQPITSQSDIANAFDAITYQKGAAVIRMFEKWVGTEKFRSGVHLYLKTHAWSNATASDFLAAISVKAGMNIAPAFSSFLDQPGVPMLSVSLQCSNGGPRLAVTQKRFLPLGSPGAPPENWDIPVCVKFGDKSGTGNDCALFKDDAFWNVSSQKCPNWLLANANEQGYYRTLYRGDLLDRLLTDGVSKLSLAEQVGTLGDARALVSAGELPAATALRLVPDLSKNPNRFITTSTINMVASLDGPMLPPGLRPNFERFVRKMYGARARELGWTPRPGESTDTRLLRPELVSFVARSGNDAVLIKEAQQLARQWLKDRDSLPPEMISAVLDTAAEYGNRALFNEFYEAAKTTTDFRNRRRLIKALGSFRNPAIAKAALKILLTDDFDIRETLSLLRGPLAYTETQHLPFDFVKENFDQLLMRLPRGIGSDSGAELPSVGAAFCSPEGEKELAGFFQPRIENFSGGPRNLAQVLESIGICSAVRKAQEPSLAQFLKKW